MLISELPTGDAPQALPYPHFPARFQAVIWRNWNRIHPAKLAQVLKTTEDNIVKAGNAMGLVRDDSALEDFKNRGFLTTIRYNWQLLDYEQLLQLLDWTPERMEFTLLEDDFLFVKLSYFKPRCGEVVYRELTPTEAEATAQIAQLTRQINAQLPQKKEPPFEFLRHLGNKKLAQLPQGENLRMIFSYSAVYGDALLPESPDPYPDALLRDYAASGINAVWMPVILYQLIPYLGENMPLSTRCAERLARLKEIAARTRKYGISLILYLNEPRGIPERVKLDHEQWRGPVQKSTGSRAFCPWAPGMLDALSAGIEKLCRAVPELGGFYTITMSENLTHCLSRVVDPEDARVSEPPEMDRECPACAQHSKAENIAAVMTAIDAGMKRAGAKMRLLAYTWAWSKKWDEKLLQLLPANVEIMSVSESGVTGEVFGCPTMVEDYSISKVGPGEQAKRMWKLAKATGHKIAAKIQANTTWEMGGIPVIPVPTLVEEHLDKLRAEGVNDFMLSWTLGGYPGGNIELIDHRAIDLARRDFGAAGDEVYAVWKEFGEAFRQLPFFSVEQIYFSPQNVGPANLLYTQKTGMAAGMVCGIPYDDLPRWGGYGHYPDEVMEKAFDAVSSSWGSALEKLRKIGETLPAEYQANFRDLWARAQGTYCCLRSTYCQIAFIRLRDAGKLFQTRALVAEEKVLAQTLLNTMTADSRIGFEAANHYFYGANELKEKIVQCDYLERTLYSGAEK